MDQDSNVMRFRLRRSPLVAEGFGFGLNVQDRGTAPVLQITSLVKECEAHKSGLVRSGDIILRINNVDVSTCTYDEAIQTLASTPMGAYASFTVRAPYGFVTRLVTIFDENGTSKTIRITERAANNNNNNQRNQNQEEKGGSYLMLSNDNNCNHKNKTHNFKTSSSNIVVENATPIASPTTNNVLPTPPSSSTPTISSSMSASSTLAVGNNTETISSSTTPTPPPQPQVQQQRRSSISIGSKPLRIRNVATSQVNVDILHQSAKQPMSCSEHVCSGSLMKQTKEHITGNCPINQSTISTVNNNLDSTNNNISVIGSNISNANANEVGRSREQTLSEAYQFMEQYYASIKRLHTPSHRDRLREIESELKNTGSYQLKQTELIFGAKLGWRNAPRCIGRIQWSKLQVFDARNCKTAQEVFEAICNQIKYATNRGNLRSAITIFPQRINGREDFRVWNQQLISYAGYNVDDNNEMMNDLREKPTSGQHAKIIGDPANVEFTQICTKLGWKGAGTKWDILPIVISVPGEDPQLFPLSEDLVLRVPLVHPHFEWFKELNLQWYALPAVSSMKFDVGGIEFPACPFSGWYMDTEIAVRDLCDTHRYNILPEVAKHMSLDVNSNASLWKDRAVIEVNTAVLYSFQKANVTIVDHHTAAESFMKHMENENRLRGGCPADWVWIVPPISGSLTPVFHQEMLNYELKPSYRYQEPAWKSHTWHNGYSDDRNSIGGCATPRKIRFKEIAKAVKFTSNLFGKALSKRIKATILYATETGRSEQFAKRLAQIFSHVFNVSLNCMDSYDMTHLEHETLLLCVTSTFGNGDPPENGESFAKQLQAIKVTGETAPDLDRDTISLPVTYLRYSSMETTDNNLNLNVDDKQRFNSTGPTSPTIFNNTSSNTDDGFTFSDHVGPLSNVRFAVFALGSSAYPNFCAFGRYLDTMLTELGGERITRLGIGDELCGQEQSFYEWSAEVFEQACEVFCLTDELDMNVVMRLAAQKPLQWCKDNVCLEFSPDAAILLEENQESKRIQQALCKLSNKKVIKYKLIERVNLHEISDNYHEINLRPTIRVTLKIDLENDEYNEETKSGAHYYPGDHLAVYPENSETLVNGIIERLCYLNPSLEPTKPYLIKVKSQQTTMENSNQSESSNSLLNQMFGGGANKSGNDSNRQESEQKWILHDRLPSPVTLEEALTRYLDITNPPTQRILSILSEHATDPDEIARLKQLSKDSASYEAWKAKYFPNFLEILTEFSSINPPLELIFTQLPMLKPRHYSISSSPLTHSAFLIDLTVAVIQYQTEGGARHYGVCSNFLNDVAVGQDVYASIRSAPNFRIPKERKVPIIMVGPGTGIAPFRSFWQHRSRLKELNQDAVYGKMTLFFGCRYPSMQLYRKEINEIVEKQVIQEYHVAYSRKPGQPKEYVQDIMRKMSKQIFKDLIENNGHIYVCGDVSMAEDVNKTLQHILQENGIHDADMTLLSLKETMRYHEDIFGITLRTAEVTNRNRSDAVKRTFSNS